MPNSLDPSGRGSTNRDVATIRGVDDVLHTRPIDAAKADRRTLTDEEDGLTPFTQPAQVRRDGIHGIERHASTQLPNVALRLLHLFGGASDRKQLATTALDLGNSLEHGVPVARELDVRERA